ncbi:MAG: CTP synthase [Phycisphaerales bacterium]|nr:CTP synthase [Phycisphaerales bacterium]
MSGPAASELAGEVASSPLVAPATPPTPPTLPTRLAADSKPLPEDEEDLATATGRTGAAVDSAGLLASVAETSATSASEYYSPEPPGYRKGAHKYIVVFGTVMSGLGKGIFSASLAKLFRDKGLCVCPMKMEGYLNIDAGTLNPYRHGEVFVLEDGTECDMDLGTYERMLDQNLTRRNFTTSGQIFSEILGREREGQYLGRDVQMIPHVTGEVKRKIRELAMFGDGRRPADVVFIEVGGTVGDYENCFYIEALRELAFEEGPGNCCFVALTYVIKPNALGEQKSKPAQLGLRKLMEAGIQPHVVACRAEEPVSPKVSEKIAMFSNVPPKRMFSMHDRPSIYTIPDEMRAEGLDREILSILSLHDRVDAPQEDRMRESWGQFVRGLTRPKPRVVDIGITGKYAHLRDAYASIDKAVEHCSAKLETQVKLHWIETTELTEGNVASRLAHLDGVIVPGGFGKRGVEGKIQCVRHCRENKVPYLGICLGFQVAVIEYARHVLGLHDANSTEFDPGTLNPLISELPDQKKIEGLGGSMRLGGQDVLITEGSLAHMLYGKKTSVRERFRHRYEVDPNYIEALTRAGLIFSGRHPKQPIMQILELPAPQIIPPHPHHTAAGIASHAGMPTSNGPAITHPFFIGGQFHPELTSRPLRPQPMFMGLLAAAIMRRYATSAEARDRLLSDSTLNRWVRTGAAVAVGAKVST